jgi:hypothetical protein
MEEEDDEDIVMNISNRIAKKSNASIREQLSNQAKIRKIRKGSKLKSESNSI